jgi:hypothetical protein
MVAFLHCAHHTSDAHIYPAIAKRLPSGTQKVERGRASEVFVSLPV